MSDAKHRCSRTSRVSSERQMTMPDDVESAAGLDGDVLDEFVGSLAETYGPGEIDTLRDEWE